MEQRIEVNRLENCVQIVKRVSHYLPRSKKKYKTTVVDITIPFEAVDFVVEKLQDIQEEWM